MNLLSIPAEVVDENILPYLEWNDLLRLRRVCLWSKWITDGYLEAHPELAPEIEINEDEKSFEAFLEMGIPTTRIFLNNPSGREFYENCGNDASSFLEQYGLLIKHLRVDQISCLVFGKEWDFLNALKNLVSFESSRHAGFKRGLSIDEEIEAIGLQQKLFLGDPRMRKVHEEKGCTAFPPDILEKLKTLKIRNEDCNVLDTPFEYTDMFIRFGKSLETIGIPFNPLADPGLMFDGEHSGDGPLARNFTLLLGYIDTDHPYVDPAPLRNCKEIDFVSFHNYENVTECNRREMESQGSSIFLALCEYCSKKGIQLMNVASNWFSRWNEGRHDAGLPIISLVNIDFRMFPVEMRNLEKIVISGTSRCVLGTEWRQRRPDWPSLKTLDVTVLLEECNCLVNCACGHHVTKRKTKELFSFLFQDVSRVALTELKLKFIDGHGDLPVPKIKMIVASCPNVKKLTLVNWLGTYWALKNLWSRLPNLEEVALEGCKDLGNVAFVGEDVKEPVFLKLTKLRKLTLGGLDQMPQITDTLFSLVIRHLELTQLYLSSGAPLESVDRLLWLEYDPCVMAGLRNRSGPSRLRTGDYATSPRKNSESMKLCFGLMT